jgi:hypothetical protein
MLAQCRQTTTMCGGLSKIDFSSATTVTRTISTSFIGTTEKCTFVAASMTGAPTFELVNVAA